jgi:hypothetical protein
MEKIKQIFISVLLSTSILCSQSYTVSVLGYHIADLKKTNPSSGNINFEFQTRGLVDFFYPTENKYTTKYDNETFHFIDYSYSINQSDLKENQTSIKDSTNVNHSDSLDSEKGVFNFITFLEVIKNKNPSEIDTKWFPYETNNTIGEARVIWADSSNVYSNKDSVLCNRYRLDIIMPETAITKDIDYLNKILSSDENVKEIWVSIKSPEIYQIKIKNDLLSLDVKINKRDIAE